MYSAINLYIPRQEERENNAVPEQKLKNKFTMYYLSWMFHYSTYSNIYLYKMQTETKHVKVYHHTSTFLWVFGFTFLHFICNAQSKGDYTADKFNNLTLELLQYKIFC